MPKARVRVLIGLIALVGIAVLIFTLVPDTQSPKDPSPTVTESSAATPSIPAATPPSPSTASQQPVPSPTATESDDPATALPMIVDGVAQELQTVDDSTDLSGLLAGDALAAQQALVEQWVAEGTHQEGAPVLEQLEVLSADSQQALVQACVVTTQVRILDSAGIDLTDAEAAKRTRMVFTLMRTEQAWKLVDESFADELDC